MAVESVSSKNLSAPPSAPRRSLRDIVRVLCRQRWLVLWVVIGCLTAAALLLIGNRPSYRAQAQLLLKAPAPALGAPAAGQPAGATERLSADGAAIEVSILTSRSVMQNALDAIGIQRLLGEGVAPGADAGPTEEAGAERARRLALQILQDGLDVSIQGNRRLLDLEMHQASPELARQALNAIIDAYLQRREALYRITAVPTELTEKQNQLQARMVQKEAELREFRSSADGFALASRLQLLIDRSAKLENDIAEVDVQMAAAEARVASLRHSVERQAEQPGADEERAKMASLKTELTRQLVDLQLKESNMSAFYPDDFRPLVDVRRQIELVREALADLPDDSGEPPLQLTLANERATLASLRARRDSLSGELAGNQAELATLGEVRARLLQLQREFDIAESEFLQYRNNLQQTEIAVNLEGLSGSAVSLMQPATVVKSPIRAGGPFAALVVTLGLLCGLVGATALALLRERFDDTLQSQSDVQQRLGLPVLAAFTAQELKQCT